MACAPGVESDRPNIVLITVDTLRSDRLSAYGYARDTSPKLEALAQDATRFTNAVTPQPLTQPSIASLFTGQYPYQHGVSDNRMPLPDAFETLAERLRADGYATAAFVSSFVLTRASSNFQQGFDTYDDELDRYVLGGAERGATATAARVSAWLRGAPTAPFFLWVHLMDPHGPYDPPAPFDTRYRSDERGERKLPRAAVPNYQFRSTLDPEIYTDRYDGEIAHTDNEVGGLLALLRELDLYRDALIVFHADHGENLGEGGAWFGHGGRLYESGIRIPLLIKFPTGSASPSVGSSERLVSTLDISPTLLSAAGIAVPSTSEGRALQDILSEEPASARRFYLEAHSGRAALSGLRSEHRTLVRRRRPGESEVLGEEYLRADLGGYVTASPDAERSALSAELDAWDSRANPARALAPKQALEQDDEAALRALGYVE